MFCLHLNISEHLTFKISSERSTCLKWELKTAHLSLLCVIWREMAFVLAQAICKKRSNGLRLLHLPLERSEDPPNQHFHLLCLPRLSDQCQTRELGFKARRHLVKKTLSHLTGSSERALIVKTYIFLQNQLLMSWVNNSQTVVIMRAALWHSCSRFGSVYLEFRPVFFIWKHFLGAHSLALCRDAEGFWLTYHAVHICSLLCQTLG